MRDLPHLDLESLAEKMGTLDEITQSEEGELDDEEDESHP